MTPTRPPLRILLLALDFPPTTGGIQTLLSNLAPSILDAEVEIVAPAHQDAAAWDKIYPCRVIRIFPLPLWAHGYVATMLAAAMVACLRRRPDVVVCGHVFAGPIAVLLRYFFGCPIVTLTYAQEIRFLRVRKLAGWLFDKSARIVAISEFTAREVMMHGVDRSKIVILPPGKRSESGADPSAGMRTRRRLGIEGRRVILTVSRLVDRYKGHDVLLRALPLVKAKVPDVTYLVAGQGWLQGYLQCLARSLGVHDDVRFLGYVPEKELPGLFAAADVFAMVSRESLSGGGAEGFGIVFLEANAAGVPTLGGRAGGVVDAIVDGRTGILVNPHDPLLVAEALVRLLTDDVLASRLGEQGRAWVREEMNWEKIGRRYRELFEDVTRFAGHRT